jgi:hypothetical protein
MSCSPDNRNKASAERSANPVLSGQQSQHASLDDEHASLDYDGDVAMLDVDNTQRSLLDALQSALTKKLTNRKMKDRMQRIAEKSTIARGLVWRSDIFVEFRLGTGSVGGTEGAMSSRRWRADAARWEVAWMYSKRSLTTDPELEPLLCPPLNRKIQKDTEERKFNRASKRKLGAFESQHSGVDSAWPEDGLFAPQDRFCASASGAASVTAMSDDELASPYPAVTAAAATSVRRFCNKRACISHTNS